MLGGGIRDAFIGFVIDHKESFSLIIGSRVGRAIMCLVTEIIQAPKISVVIRVIVGHGDSMDVKDVVTGFVKIIQKVEARVNH